MRGVQKRGWLVPMGFGTSQGAYRRGGLLGNLLDLSVVFDRRDLSGHRIEKHAVLALVTEVKHVCEPSTDFVEQRPFTVGVSGLAWKAGSPLGLAALG